MTSPTRPESPALAAATAMFVEVLVVGIGALTAAVLLLVALVGPVVTAELAPVADSSMVAGAGLAAAYALGVLIDRVADAALSSHRRRLRTGFFSSSSAYAQARMRLAGLPVLAVRADYARSRMRICRGWLFNTLALTLTASLAMLRYSFEHRLLTLGIVTALGAVTAFGFYWAWRALTMTSYRKLAEQTASPAASSPVPVPPRPRSATPHP